MSNNPLNTDNFLNTESSQEIVNQSYLLATLANHQPLTTPIELGAKAGLEDFALMQDAKLSKERHAQVLAQLNRDDELYTLWLEYCLPNLSSELDSELDSELAADKSSTSKPHSLNRSKLLIRIQDWLQSAFTLPRGLTTGLATTCGLALGLAVGLGLQSEDSDTSNLNPITFEAPLTSPSKASKASKALKLPVSTVTKNGLVSALGKLGFVVTDETGGHTLYVYAPINENLEKENFKLIFKDKVGIHDVSIIGWDAENLQYQVTLGTSSGGNNMELRVFRGNGL